MQPHPAGTSSRPQTSTALGTHDLRRFCARDPLRSFSHLGASIALYVACYFVAVSRGSWAKVIAWLVQAIVLVGVTSVIHECIHGLFARARLVNRWLGAIAAAILLKNYTLHRAFHLRHHACTTKEDDPEPRADLRSVRDYLMLAARRGNILFTTYISCVGTWHAVRGDQPQYLPSSELVGVRQDALIEVFWVVAVLASFAIRPWPTIFGYVIPLCISSSLSFLVFLPEHYGTTFGSALAIDNTRTIRSNALFRFLFWNNNFHAEHHAFPGVPYFQLQRVHRLMGDNIAHNMSSYTQFHLQLIRQLATNHHHKQQH